MNNYKLLIIYRLFDPAYGVGGNPCTLAVSLRDDGTLHHSFYSGWQNSGTGQSVSNFGLKRSLPISIKGFSTTEKLEKEIRSILATGYGSSKVKSHEIVNEIKEKKEKTVSATKEQKIITARSASELDALMNKMITDGWEPVGGHFVVEKHHQLRYAGMQHKDTMVDCEYSLTMRKI